MKKTAYNSVYNDTSQKMTKDEKKKASNSFFPGL